ncbi:MAG: acetate--CoA ligase family protein [Candidatus Aenigmarchaeota archaeon]|nr:acetate--CoA ligase family protein [Candidatus Aenigmarchaeota archaeon]
MENYGIEIVPTILVNDAESAIRFAKKVGFPLVAKVSSPDIVHKSDVGGVVVNIVDEIELINAIESIRKNVKERLPNAKIEGIVLQKMVKGTEIIIGGIVDPTFGTCVSFGSGGILTEIYEDVSFRVVPITRKDAKEMIQETKIYKVLRGYRNIPKANINSLVSLLLKVSKLMEKMSEIKELDLNPVFATPEKALVADVRIIVE